MFVKKVLKFMCYNATTKAQLSQSSVIYRLYLRVCIYIYIIVSYDRELNLNLNFFIVFIARVDLGLWRLLSLFSTFYFIPGTYNFRTTIL